MRIVAGRFARRKLESSPGETTRPIPDYVKESLFARLEHHFEGARVADVFSGTGTIGLEALSRGAASAIFIEKDPRAFELLQKNVRALGVESDVLCWPADVFRCSFRPRSAERFVPCDFVFLDPPYRLVASLAPGSPLFKAVERIGRPDFTAPNAVLALRTPDRAEFTLPPQWQPWQALPRAGFSTMDVWLFQKATEPAPASQPDPEEPDRDG